MPGNLDGVSNDYAMGWVFDADDPARKPDVEVTYNGRVLARLTASFPREDVRKAGIGDGRNGFFVALPLLTDNEDAEIAAYVAETGELLGAPQRLTRRPQCSRGGLLAADVLPLQEVPLHSVTAVELTGERLRVHGMHQPPAGNPSALRITSTEGTAFTLDHPLSSENVGHWYWYWPNAGFSAYVLDIDLAASTDPAPHYEFAFQVDDSVAGEPTPAAFSAVGRNRLWVPKDLRVYQNFPGGEQMSRVHRFDNQQRVAINGYSDHMRLRMVAERYGIDLSEAHVLDWGCGHGRVLRHLADPGHLPVADAWGVDVDPENVGWMVDHLPGVRGSVVPLMPPTELPADHFDFVFAISVMTHLTEDAQAAWLDELRRVCRPGAIIALTFNGTSGIAFASRFHTPGFLERLQETGFDASQVNDDLEGKIGDDSYYRNTRQLPEQVRSAWAEHLEVVDILPCVFGYQDLAILRVPA